MQKSVLEYLENSAEKFPDKIVFADEAEEITYRDFRKEARAVATGLAKASQTARRKPVVVFIERNIRSLIGFFGVIYSGNFYVPVDCQMPAKRIELIFDTLKPVAVITTESTRKIMDRVEFKGPVLALEELKETPVQEEVLNDISRREIDTDPLYAIFTSGSTGVPKGVLVGHRSVIDLIDNFQKEFGFDDTIIMGNQAPFDFDVSVKDIYSTIKNGGTMYVLPKVMFSMPGKLIDALNRHKINTVIWATSALRIIENLNVFSQMLPQYLRTVMFSGEIMSNKVLNYWRNYLKEVMYVNLYGPTEITCNCTYYKVDRSFRDEEVLPIGIAFENTEILLLDDERKAEVPPGEPGEICIRGTALTLGYYKDKERTDQVFVQNPLNDCYHELIYRTGDIGKYNEYGELLFLSRKDCQIKHMGHRIELGEIEAHVHQVDGIHSACCIYDKEKEKITLFYSGVIETKELVANLKKTLPRYMIPNHVYSLETMPLTANGKVDRTTLKQMIKSERTRRE